MCAARANLAQETNLEPPRGTLDRHGVSRAIRSAKIRAHCSVKLRLRYDRGTSGECRQERAPALASTKGDQAGQGFTRVQCRVADVGLSAQFMQDPVLGSATRAIKAHDVMHASAYRREGLVFCRSPEWCSCDDGTL